MSKKVLQLILILAFKGYIIEKFFFLVYLNYYILASEDDYLE